MREKTRWAALKLKLSDSQKQCDRLIHQLETHMERHNQDMLDASKREERLKRERDLACNSVNQKVTIIESLRAENEHLRKEIDRMRALGVGAIDGQGDAGPV